MLRINIMKICIMICASVVFYLIDFASLSFFYLPVVFAHCDTMDGPVVKDAQRALETGKVDIILKWVQEKDEPAIKKAFDHTLAVRNVNAQAKELADMYFFETLVRIHRAGEGAPFTGILPAGTHAEPGIEEADKAVEKGSIDVLSSKLSADLGKVIRDRFKTVMAKKKHMNESVHAGREFVESYVTFIHYIEKIHQDIFSQPAHGEGAVEQQNSKAHGH